MPRQRRKQDVAARTMDEGELRTAYTKIYLKYAAQGVFMKHPEQQPIFHKEEIKSHFTRKSVTERQEISENG